MGFGASRPGFRGRVGILDLRPESWDVGLGLWDSGFRTAALGVWDLGPGLWDSGFRIWDLGPGAWDLGLGFGGVNFRV